MGDASGRPARTSSARRIAPAWKFWSVIVPVYIIQKQVNNFKGPKASSPTPRSSMRLSSRSIASWVVLDSQAHMPCVMGGWSS
jgi:hypothetical protein